MINEHSLSFLRIREKRLGLKRTGGGGTYLRGWLNSGFKGTSAYILRRKNMQKFFCYSIEVRLQNVANKMVSEKGINVVHAAIECV